LLKYFLDEFLVLFFIKANTFWALFISAAGASTTAGGSGGAMMSARIGDELIEQVLITIPKLDAEPCKLFFSKFILFYAKVVFWVNMHIKLLKFTVNFHSSDFQLSEPITCLSHSVPPAELHCARHFRQGAAPLQVSGLRGAPTHLLGRVHLHTELGAYHTSIN
jgi:hypothetical protein